MKPTIDDHHGTPTCNKRTLYIPSQTWKRVDEQSRKTGMSKSRLICLLIEEAAHLVAPSSLRLGR